MDKSGYWDRPTRYLHFGLALTVTVQLLISLVMEEPHGEHARSALESGAFEVHEWVGMAALAIVLLHWLWSLLSHGGAGLGHLFPWGAGGRARVLAELRAILRGQLPEGGPQGGLAGLVHGLGLLTITAMAVSGGVLFFLLPENGAPLSEGVHDIGELHSFIATFAWIYWGAHLALAVLHHLFGHDTLRGMFRP